jgi:hypothetical protein
MLWHKKGGLGTVKYRDPLDLPPESRQHRGCHTLVATVASEEKVVNPLGFVMQNYLSLDEVALEDVERLGPDAAFAYLSFSRIAWKRGPVPDDLTWLRKKTHPSFLDSFDKGWLLIRPLLAHHGGKVSIERLERARREIAQKSRGTVPDVSMWIDGSAADTVPDTVPDTVVASERNGTERNGEDPPPPARPRAPRTGAHPELLRFWESEWLRTRGVPWAWAQPDLVAIAKCLKLAGEEGQREVEARITRILENQDRWTADNASPRILASHWNKHGFKIVHKQKTALQSTLEGLEQVMGSGGLKELA